MSWSWRTSHFLVGKSVGQTRSFRKLNVLFSAIAFDNKEGLHSFADARRQDEDRAIATDIAARLRESSDL
jgi:hypothetical protein